MVNLYDMFEIDFSDQEMIRYRSIGDEKWTIENNPKTTIMRLIGLSVEDALNNNEARIAYSNADYVRYDRHLEFYVYNTTLRFEVEKLDLEQVQETFQIILKEVKETVAKYPPKLVTYTVEFEEEALVQ